MKMRPYGVLEGSSAHLKGVLSSSEGVPVPGAERNAELPNESKQGQAGRDSESAAGGEAERQILAKGWWPTPFVYVPTGRNLSIYRGRGGSQRGCSQGGTATSDACCYCIRAPNFPRSPRLTISTTVLRDYISS